MDQHQLFHILDKTTHGFPPSHEEIILLLSLRDSESIQLLMSASREVRGQYFGNKIFLYGFIYFSTYCRNHCTFCFYRKTNTKSPRYRKPVDEVVEIACRLADSDVHLIDLTMGEDPLIHDTGHFDTLFKMIEGIKKRTGLPVMISPGIVPDDVLYRFAELNADWYALYQETHNPLLFKKLRTGQSYEERRSKRSVARHTGMLVEDGILVGVGESILDRAKSIINLKQSDVDQARVMSFIPQPQTPLANRRTPTRLMECLCIAVMRLTMPDRLIPASLDVDGINGLKMRLDSGANVVTSIIPPTNALAGVSQSFLDIEEGFRTVSEVNRILTSMGLQVASAEDYQSWISFQKRNGS